MQPKTTKRDHLISIEEQVQKQWSNSHIFEPAPSNNKKKYFVTFPYPYMNGVLHLGHAFTLSKAEFAAGYKRLKGYNVLFPFAFHCTGMPICAAANKLKSELDKFGNTPNFNVDKEEKDDNKNNDTGARKKKGKEQKKKSSFVFQYQIMKEMGVPEDKIKNFVDPEYWTKYFPPIAQADCIRFGLKADFRRAFITTELNPYYDSFVKWQFNLLSSRNKLEFGKRISIFSPIDDQVCADHDRSSGEGVQPQEYTGIKLKLDTTPEALKELKLKSFDNVYLIAATLRPETMYGQTNCWVLPSGNYGIYKVNIPDDVNEIYILSERSALNLKYQLNNKSYEKIGTITGAELLGHKVIGPLNLSHSSIPVLPLLTIDMAKGTGIVTSVPSDSPDDYVALNDLKALNKTTAKSENKSSDSHLNNMLKKCCNNLDFKEIENIEIIPIIEIPGYSNISAQDLVSKLNIKNQLEKDKLEQAKDEVYLKGFTNGIILVGEYAKSKISVVKPKIRDDLIKMNLAISYYEPQSLVMSRSGNECVCAFTDQWFIKYGSESEQNWKLATKDHISNVLETFNPKAKSMYLEVIDWLHEWAVSRTFGLGSKLPCDNQHKFLIESLSDSTIYMAYYTISHLLQGNNNLDGKSVGPIGLTPNQLTDQVFNYIFLDQDYPKESTKDFPSKDVLDKLKNEFNYWYPLDLRVSGKDLIRNHLTMCLYNHSAIWDNKPEFWPRSFYTNGHVMINAEKMSKSTGNFLTLSQAMQQYGADATRLALADSGDSLDDSNFETSTANAAILRLFTEEHWIQDEVINNSDNLRTGNETFWDNIFINEMNRLINEADKAYKKMLYREALKFSLYEFTAARDTYRLTCGKNGLHKKTIEFFIESFLLLLSPICPHITEHIWHNICKKPGFIVNATWPNPTKPVDTLLKQKSLYIQDLSIRIKTLLQTKKQKMAKKSKPSKDESKVSPPSINSCYLTIRTEYDEADKVALKLLESFYNSESKKYNDGLVEKVKNTAILGPKAMKRVINLSNERLVQANEFGDDYKNAFVSNPPFDELDLLTNSIQSNSDDGTIIGYIFRDLDIKTIKISTYSEVVNKNTLDNKNSIESDILKSTSTPIPLQPSVYFYSS